MALRKLALDDDKNVAAARVQIWNYFQPLITSQERLRTEAIAEKDKAPSDLAKLFWRDVAEYALSPTKPQI